MTTTAAKKQRETWEAWIPDGTVIPDADLITREELLTSLHNIGVKVSARDLANWQTGGVIPYGKWQWHEPTRKTRALYPPAMIPLIVRLRQFQDEGMQLRDIGPRLRTFTLMWSASNEPADPNERNDPALGIETPMQDILKLKALLTQIAETHGRQIGRPVTFAEVRLDLTDPDVESRIAGLAVDLTDASGALFTYSWP